MKRQLVCWFALFLLVAGVTMKNSLEMRAKEAYLAALKNEIKSEEERLRVLTAEWASLSAPERLEILAEKYLALTPLQSTDMLVVADLPAPIAVLDNSEEPALLAGGLPLPKAKPVREQLAVLADADTLDKAIVEDAAPIKVATRQAAAKDDMINTLIMGDNKPGVLWANYRMSE